MKIGISGTHGIGKSTLAAEMASILKLPLITETARTIIRKRGGYMDVVDLQTEILDLQMEKEKKMNKFVSDRTVLDILAYSIYFLGVKHEFIETIQEDVMQHLMDYDLIIYCPIPNQYKVDEKDEIRLKNGVKEVDEIMKVIIKMTWKHIHYLLLPTDRDLWVTVLENYFHQQESS